MLPQELEDKLVFVRTYAEALYGLCAWNIGMCMDEVFLREEGAALLGAYFTVMVQVSIDLS